MLGVEAVILYQGGSPFHAPEGKVQVLVFSCQCWTIDCTEGFRYPSMTMVGHVNAREMIQVKQDHCFCSGGYECIHQKRVTSRNGATIISEHRAENLEGQGVEAAAAHALCRQKLHHGLAGAALRAV